MFYLGIFKYVGTNILSYYLQKLTNGSGIGEGHDDRRQEGIVFREIPDDSITMYSLMPPA